MDKKIIINEVINSGLDITQPIVEEKDYHSKDFKKTKEPVLGAITPLSEPPIIFPDGRGWLKVAKEYGEPEIQFNRKLDTFSCVIFGIAKAICYYIFKVYGIKVTISEMFNAFYAGVVPNRGTSVRKGFESFRTKGWVEDSEYPFTAETTLQQFFAEPPKTIQVKAEGKLTTWDFHWEVIPNNLKSIFEHYKRTPIVLTGFAWASYYGEGVYYDYNNPANHLFLGLEPAENGNNIIDDSYPKDFKYSDQVDLRKDDLFKELHKSFSYGSAHRCWVTPVNNNSIITKIMDKIIQLANGALYWLKANTTKAQKITKENAGFAAITHIMRKTPGDVIQIENEEELLKKYELTEEYFGSENLGVSNKL